MLSFWQTCSNLLSIKKWLFQHSKIISVFTVILCSWCTLLIAMCHGIEIKWVWQCSGGRKEERKHAEHLSCFPLLDPMPVSDMWKADRRVQREWGHRSLREHMLGIDREKCLSLGWGVKTLIGNWFGIRMKSYYTEKGAK